MSSGRPGRAVAARHLAAEQRPDRPVRVADRQREVDAAGPRRAPARRPASSIARVEAAPRRRRSCGRPAPPCRGRPWRGGGAGAEVETARLRVLHAAPRGEEVAAADDLVERASAERRQVLADLGRHEAHERHDVVRVAAVARPQLGILGGDPDRAGVEVAGPHHHAAEGDERRRREAELLGAEQRPDDDVAAGPQLAVHLDHDPARAGRWRRGPGASRRGRAPTARRRA